MHVAVVVRDFHVCAAEWARGDVAFVVDGEPVKHVAQSPGYPLQLMLDIYEFPATAGRSTGSYPKEFVERRIVEGLDAHAEARRC